MISAGQTLADAISRGVKSAETIAGKLNNACLDYSMDADAGVYEAFARELGYSGERYAFGAACMDHFLAMTQLPPSSGVYKAFYTKAGVLLLDDDNPANDDKMIEDTNKAISTPIPKTKAQCAEEGKELDGGVCKACGDDETFDKDSMSCKSAPLDKKYEAGFSVSFGGSKPPLVSDQGDMSGGDYAEEGEGGSLHLNPRIAYDGAWYFSGNRMRGVKLVHGLALEFPITSARENGDGLREQDTLVGFGAMAMLGIGGTVGSPEYAFDADLFLAFGARYVNKLILADMAMDNENGEGTTSGWMGVLDVTGRVGMKFLVGNVSVVPGFYCTFSPHVSDSLTGMTSSPTNPDKQGSQGRVTPGGSDEYGISGGFYIKIQFGL